jgi:hypothetical protein
MSLCPGLVLLKKTTTIILTFLVQNQPLVFLVFCFFLTLPSSHPVWVNKKSNPFVSLHHQQAQANRTQDPGQSAG